MSLADTTFERYEKDSTVYFLKLVPAGSSAAQLFRYDEASNGTTLSPALYTFAVSHAQDLGLDGGDNDASDLYFADGNRLLSLPLDASAAGAAQLVATLPAGAFIDDIYLGAFSSTRLVFATENHGNNVPTGIYSVPKTASNATATILKLNSATAVASLVSVVGDLAYINVDNPANGAVSALRISSDGASKLNTANAYWAGFSMPTSVDFSQASTNHFVPVRMLRATKSSSGDTLRVVTASTGAIGRVLGTVASTAHSESVFGVAFGNLVPLTASITRSGGGDDFDAFVCNLGVSDSLQPVATTPGGDDFPMTSGD
jgi:hypothetical protein